MYPVSLTNAPNCRLLTVWQAIANGVRVIFRTGPSPSSGKRLSCDPIRKEPPISGLQRRRIGVGLGVIDAAALAGSPASSRAPCTQQWGLASVIGHRGLILFLFFPKRGLALGFHQGQDLL